MESEKLEESGFHCCRCLQWGSSFSEQKLTVVSFEEADCEESANLRIQVEESSDLVIRQLRSIDRQRMTMNRVPSARHPRSSNAVDEDGLDAVDAKNSEATVFQATVWEFLISFDRFLRVNLLEQEDHFDHSNLLPRVEFCELEKMRIFFDVAEVVEKMEDESFPLLHFLN